MAHPDVVDAIEAHVRSVFDACPVLVENGTAEMPLEAGAYLAIGFPYSRSEQVTVGEIDDADIEERGAFTLTLAVPRGLGTQEGRRQLEDVARTVRARMIGPVWCHAPQTPTLDDGDGSEPYVDLIMAVPYTFQGQG